MSLLIVIFFTITFSQLDYTDQTTWTGSCNVGVRQSPINVPCGQYVNTCPAGKQYQIYWKNPLVAFGNSSFEDLKTFYSKQSWVKFSNETNDYVYKSLQLHFHTPSEHTINGVQYDL
jgi:carbonic anhydrase